MSTAATLRGLGVDTDAPAISPEVSAALATAKEKIRKRVETDVSGLSSNLKLILDHFTDAHGVRKISWSGLSDVVQPGFAIDLLAARLVEELTAIEYRKFLETFVGCALELSAAEARSQ
jgi:hypothetical protein